MFDIYIIMPTNKLVYCGAKAVPKGKKRGSMVDCVKNSQIRYYGIKTVDNKLIEAHAKKKLGKTKEQVIQGLKEQIAAMNGRKRRLLRELAVENNRKVKNNTKIEDIRRQGKETVARLKELRGQYRKLA